MLTKFQWIQILPSKAQTWPVLSKGKGKGQAAHSVQSIPVTQISTGRAQCR